MGSGPESFRYLLQELQCRPHAIRCSAPRPVLLRRGDNHKLGFRFKTYPCREASETVTVVVQVKGDCRIESGSLQVGDRILRIGDVLVTGLEEDRVKQAFTQLRDSAVRLEVAAMSRADPSAQIKRFLSVNSGASGGSVTASLDSGERPQVKRFQKSSSTETPPPAVPSADFSSPSSSLIPRSAGEAPPARRNQSCAVRECADSSRLGFLFHSPHLATNCHSLPDRMDGDLVLLDDIVVCEVDGPNSLPPVLPNIPTPSPLTQPPAAAFVSTVSAGIGGSVGGDAPSAELASQRRSLGVDVCRMPGCSAQKVCLWHKFVLTYPQYVVWEPITKTVVLEKRDKDNFGFKFKVKKYDGPPMEVFALVTEVISGGVAWTLLLSGDWIRSINGKPIHTDKEAHGQDFRKLSSLRLVIQRPERLSQKGLPKLKALALSLGITLHVPLPADAPLHQPPAPIPDRGQQEEVGRVREQNQFDPLLDQYPRQTQSPGEHIPLSTLYRSPALLQGVAVSDRCVLPQARVLVCGAHGSAADFVRGLVGESGGVNVDGEAPVQSFQLSIKRGAGTGTYVHSQRESLTALVKDLESVMHGAGQSVAEQDRVRCIDLELYVVSDQQFFHHCCSWLLPSLSLLILTFPVHKLLNQPQVETRRLAAMVHTLQACAGGVPASQTLLYGVPSGTQHDVSAEEVQGMFYVTDPGSRLLERHGLAVHVAVPTCPQSMAATRQALFSSCRRRLCQVPNPQRVARAVDSLAQGSRVKMIGGEVTSVVSRVLGDGDPVMVQSVVGSLVDTGCLLACGDGQHCREAEPQDYLLPFNTFQALSSLLIKPVMDTYTPERRQKWFRLMTTGRVSRSELGELLVREGSSLTVDVLEQLGIVFMLQASSTSRRGDSGFAEDVRGDFLMPYFLQDAREQREGDRGGFVLRFEGHVSWGVYYSILCRLSSLPATEEVVVRDQVCSVVRHNGLTLSLLWRKDSGCDSMLVSVNRSPGRRESLIPQELEQLFSCVIPGALPFKLQAVDVTTPSSNLPSAEPEAVAQAARPVRPCHDLEEETFVKPVVDAADSPLHQDGPYSNLPLTFLPWSVLKQVAILLTVAMPAGHDWKSVAEKAGKTVPEIFAYEVVSSQELPAMSFLREWIWTATVQQFLDILESLDRPDVRDVVLEYLKEAKEEVNIQD